MSEVCAVHSRRRDQPPRALWSAACSLIADGRMSIVADSESAQPGGARGPHRRLKHLGDRKLSTCASGCAGLHVGRTPAAVGCHAQQARPQYEQRLSVCASRSRSMRPLIRTHTCHPQAEQCHALPAARSACAAERAAERWAVAEWTHRKPEQLLAKCSTTMQRHVNPAEGPLC